MVEHASRRNTFSFFAICIAASISIFFGTLKLINFFNIKFYYFYYPEIINIPVFSAETDLWIWGTSLFLLTTALLLMTLRQRNNFPKWTILPYLLTLIAVPLALGIQGTITTLGIVSGFITIGLWLLYINHTDAHRWKNLTLILFCVVALLLVFESASLLTWIGNAFDYSFPLSSTEHWRFAIFDLQTFNVLYPWTSWIYLAFLFSWLWLPLSKLLFSKIKQLQTISLTTQINPSLHPTKLKGKLLKAGLIATLIAAVFIAYYPYIHLSNSTLVGTDSTYYFNWLQEMHQKGPFIALEKDRPVSNLFMYSIQTLTASPTEVAVRIMPIILAVGLSIAVFWFVKTGTKNEQLALMSALLTVLSFQTTVSIYIHNLSNWLALSEAFILFALFLKSKENHLWKYTAFTSILGILLLLTHPYTWEVIMIILLIYSGWTIMRVTLKKVDEKVEIRQLATIVGVNLAFFAVYALLPFGRGVSYAGETTLGQLTLYFNFSNVINIQTGLENMVQAWAGGLFGNPLLMILALIGTFPLVKANNSFNRLMVVWVAVPAVALLMFAPNTFLFYRVMYLIPIQIFAAAGLTVILDKLEATSGLKKNKSFQALKILIIILVVVVLLNCALRSVDGAPLHMLEP